MQSHSTQNHGSSGARASSPGLTPALAAKVLDGCEYGDECSREFEAMLKANGLVAVFGASDDLMEFRGAIHDEVGCYDGGTAYLARDGLLHNDCDDDRCPHFHRAKKRAAFIEAVWGDDGDGFSWKYKTEIPHEKFTVKEDGENYCEGIVFALSDVKAAHSLSESSS